MTDHTKKKSALTPRQKTMLEIADAFTTETAKINGILDWLQGMDDMHITRADIRRDLAAAREAEAQEAEAE